MSTLVVDTAFVANKVGIAKSLEDFTFEDFNKAIVPLSLIMVLDLVIVVKEDRFRVLKSRYSEIPESIFPCSMLEVLVTDYETAEEV